MREEFLPAVPRQGRWATDVLGQISWLAGARNSAGSKDDIAEGDERIAARSTARRFAHAIQ
jgi:hypothetical protein